MYKLKKNQIKFNSIKLETITWMSMFAHNINLIASQYFFLFLRHKCVYNLSLTLKYHY